MSSSLALAERATLPTPRAPQPLSAAVPRREIRRRLGYLPQNLGYYPGFTVAEFVEYFALLKEMPPGRVPRAVAAAIEQVGLGGKARARLRTRSPAAPQHAALLHPHSSQLIPHSHQTTEAPCPT